MILLVRLLHITKSKKSLLSTTITHGLSIWAGDIIQSLRNCVASGVSFAAFGSGFALGFRCFFLSSNNDIVINSDACKCEVKVLSPLFSGHKRPFLALWLKKSRKFVAIINNRLIHVYEFLRWGYVARSTPSMIDTIFGTLYPGRAKRRGRAKPRIDPFLPPEKVTKEKANKSTKQKQ
jgi:hypothetical protein